MSVATRQEQKTRLVVLNRQIEYVMRRNGCWESWAARLAWGAGEPLAGRLLFLRRRSGRACPCRACAGDRLGEAQAGEQGWPVPGQRGQYGSPGGSDRSGCVGDGAVHRLSDVASSDERVAVSRYREGRTKPRPAGAGVAGAGVGAGGADGVGGRRA